MGRRNSMIPSWIWKRKRLSIEPEAEKPVEVRVAHIDSVAVEDELLKRHYMRLHCARAMMETQVQIGDVKKPVVALIDHESEINLMSMDFYKKGKWPINTKHGWKLHVMAPDIEELHWACPNV